MLSASPADVKDIGVDNAHYSRLKCLGDMKSIDKNSRKSFV